MFYLSAVLILFVTASLLVEAAPIDANHTNTTEQNVIGLKNMTFDSFVFKQLSDVRAEAEKIRLYMANKVTDETFIDLYNDVAVKVNDFIDAFVKKISENNLFEDAEKRVFFDDLSNQWLLLQEKITRLTDTYNEHLLKEKEQVDDAIKQKTNDVKQAALRFIESGFEAVRDIVSFTLSSVQSYITEKKTPINQQSVISFLNSQKLHMLGKPEDHHSQKEDFTQSPSKSSTEKENKDIAPPASSHLESPPPPALDTKKQSTSSKPDSADKTLRTSTTTVDKETLDALSESLSQKGDTPLK